MSNTVIHTATRTPPLESRLMSDLNRIKTADPLAPIVLVVRNRTLGQYLLWRLAEQGVNCFNLRALSIGRLGRELNSVAAGGDERPPVPLEGERTAVMAAIEAAAEQSYFHAIAQRPGFQRALYSTFTEFDRERITSVPRHTTAGKAEAINELYGEYRKRLSPYRLSADDLILPDDAPALFRAIYGTDRLYIYGITSPSPAEQQLITALANGIDISVYLTFIPGADSTPFSFVLPAFRFFSGLPDAKVEMDSQPSPGLSDCLFRYSEPVQEVKDNGKIAIFRALDPVAEINGIIERINEHALHCGIPFDRIGILLWQPGNYHRELLRQLKAAGFPVADQIGITAAETIPGRTLPALLALNPRTLNRRTLVDLLARFPLTLPPGSDPVVWELISIKAGIIEGDRKKWEETLTGYRDWLKGRIDKGGSEPFPVEQIGFYLGFISQLFDLLEPLREADSWDRFATLTGQLIEAFLPPGNLAVRISEVAARLSELGVILHHPSYETWVKTVENVISSLIVERGRYREEGITVVNRSAGAFLSYDLLFVPGMTQKDVPVHPKGDPILPDEDRRQIWGNGEAGLPLRSAREDEEKLLFALILGAAENRLVFSYPAGDEEGKDTQPSYFLLELGRLMTGQPIDSDGLRRLACFEDDLFGEKEQALAALQVRITRPSSFPLRWCQTALEVERNGALYPKLFAEESKFPEFHRSLTMIRARKQPDSFSVYDGRLAPGWNPSPYYTVTGLENYASCPFSYLSARVWGLQEWREPELVQEIDSATIGSVMHQVLEEFILETVKAGRLPLRTEDIAWGDETIERLLGEVLRRFERDNAAPRAVWEIARLMILQRLTRYIRWEVEHPSPLIFRSAETWVTTELAFGDTNLQFTGKIDRIDVAPDGSRIAVIDYKTGSKTPKADDFRGGQSLQLPLYLMAQARSDPRIVLTRSYAEYRYILHSGEVKQAPVTGEWIESRSGELETIISGISTGIREGAFVPYFSGDACKYCPFMLMCDPERRRGDKDGVPDDEVVRLLASLRGVS